MSNFVRMTAVTVLLAAVMALVVACGDDGDDSGGGPQTASTSTPASQAAATPTTPSQPAPTAASAGGAGPQTVTLIDFGYTPASLNARAGQQVTLNLQNTGNAPHTFTIDGLVDSGRLAGGASGSVQFTPTQAGTLTYYCTIHGRDRMSGTLTVTAGASGAPSAPPQPAAPSGASTSPGYDGNY